MACALQVTEQQLIDFIEGLGFTAARSSKGGLCKGDSQETEELSPHLKPAAAAAAAAAAEEKQHRSTRRMAIFQVHGKPGLTA